MVLPSNSDDDALAAMSDDFSLESSIRMKKGHIGLDDLTEGILGTMKGSVGLGGLVEWILGIRKGHVGLKGLAGGNHSVWTEEIRMGALFVVKG